MSKEPMGNEGAKQARAAIKQFNNCLNSPAAIAFEIENSDYENIDGEYKFFVL